MIHTATMYCIECSISNVAMIEFIEPKEMYYEKFEKQIKFKSGLYCVDKCFLALTSVKQHI